MKKLLSAVLMTTVCISAAAQNIGDYNAKIDSIVTAEKSKMSIEMDAVDQKFEEGKITSEQKITAKQEIAGKYENIINEKIDAESTAFQKLTKEAAVQSVFRKEADTLGTTTSVSIAGKNSVISVKRSTEKTPKDYLKNDDMAVSYAFLNLAEDAGSLNPFESASQMRIGNSHSFEIQARRERQLGDYESPFFIRYGLAYRNDTYMPKRSLVAAQDDGNLFLEEFQLGSLKRSKLRNVYLTFPVEFQWVLNPKYTESEGQTYLDNRKKQFRIGLGAYAGVRLRSIVKVKYYNEDDKFKKYSDVLDYGVNSFLFGAKFSIAFGGMNLFIKKDLTPIFNKEALLAAKNGIMIGIDFADLNF